MASSLSDLFGERKVFLLNTKTGEEVELGKITADSIALDPAENGEDKTVASIYNGQKLAFSFTLHPEDSKKALELFRVELERRWNNIEGLIRKYERELQKVRKPRKTTYKTVRRDCAKRNRHK